MVAQVHNRETPSLYMLITVACLHRQLSRLADVGGAESNLKISVFCSISGQILRACLQLLLAQLQLCLDSSGLTQLFLICLWLHWH